MSYETAEKVLDLLRDDPRFETILVKSMCEDWDTMSLGHELFALMEEAKTHIEQDEREQNKGRFLFDDDKANFPNNIDNHLGEI